MNRNSLLSLRGLLCCFILPLFSGLPFLALRFVVEGVPVDIPLFVPLVVIVLGVVDTFFVFISICVVELFHDNCHNSWHCGLEGSGVYL